MEKVASEQPADLEKTIRAALEQIHSPTVVAQLRHLGKQLRTQAARGQRHLYRPAIAETMKTVAGVRKRDAPSYFKAVEALSGVRTEAQCFEVLLPAIFAVFGSESESGL